MSYGYYDDTTREYVVTDPETPRPWTNYLGEGVYGGIVTNTGGGYSFHQDPRNQRVTRYRYNSIPRDQPGRYVYLRDADSGEFWSPTYQPVKRDLDDYECRHGPGYTTIEGAYDGITGEMTYFVPPGERCEVWSLEVTNESDRTRTLETYSYVEFSFPDAYMDQTNLDWTGQIMQAEADPNRITMVSSAMEIDYVHATSGDPVGFDTDREAFVGTYDGLENPEVVVDGEPTGSVSTHGNVIGSFTHELTLEPGESERIIYLTAPEADDRVIDEYTDPDAVDRAFEDLAADWDDYLSTMTVDTPDEKLNAMLNVWNPIQCRSTLYWSRSASLYQAGLGRGMGTRDSGQDTLSIVHAVPDQVRETLEMLWGLQFADGHTWHQVYPLSGEGDVGIANEEPEKPQWFSDDHLWLVLGTVQYVKETGDTEFLDREIDFEDTDPAPVLEHIRRALQFTDKHRGTEGLPRLGYSDWNDTLNADHGSGKAASVMTGALYCRALDQAADLFEFLGDDDQAAAYRDDRDSMADLIDEVAWDGDHYIRGYDDEGRPIGASDNEFNQITLNAQTWSILGGIADDSRGEQALSAAHDRLNTEYGFALIDPPYDVEGTLDRIGGTTTYPPGAKENGGIFCHAHTWSIVAAAMLGDGERAHQYYRQLNPLEHEDIAEKRLTEPYVFSQNVLGPEHPDFGEASNSWLTGTASWAYVAGTQYLIGVRPTFDGLVIDPTIPSEWDEFEVRREFRGATYEITVENPESVESGVAEIEVDGERIDDEVVPAFEDGESHDVRV
ncbi:MAG: GH36-type glycosyl hydrolase domain-containing protein, partial [Halococcoides sp.]